MFVKWTPNETSLFRGVWGSPPPRNCLASGVANGTFQCHFGSLFSNSPTPSPSKKFSSDLHWSQEWSWELENNLKMLIPDGFNGSMTICQKNLNLKFPVELYSTSIIQQHLLLLWFLSTLPKCDSPQGGGDVDLFDGVINTHLGSSQFRI